MCIDRDQGAIKTNGVNSNSIHMYIPLLQQNLLKHHRDDHAKTELPIPLSYKFQHPDRGKPYFGLSGQMLVMCSLTQYTEGPIFISVKMLFIASENRAVSSMLPVRCRN